MMKSPITDRQTAIEMIVYILECGHQHSDCPHSWGVPGNQPGSENFTADESDDSEIEIRSNEFYYAYSHLSFVCSCIWSNIVNEGVDAETFSGLLYDKPDSMKEAVEKLLSDSDNWAV